MGAFFDKLKRGSIAGPRRREFTQSGWKEAAEVHGLNDKKDQSIFLSGLLINIKLRAIRDTLSQSSLLQLSTTTRVKALVAAANHQLGVLEWAALKKTIPVAGDKENKIDIVDLSKFEVNLVDGVKSSVDVVLSNLLDGLSRPLVAALKASKVEKEDSFDSVQWSHVKKEINLGILYGQAEGLWEDCLWNAYILVLQDSRVLAVPTDECAKTGAIAASARKVSLGIEATIYAKQALNDMRARGLIPKIFDVRKINYEDGRQTIEVGNSEIDWGSDAMLLAVRFLASPAYYQNLMVEPQQLLKGLTLSQLFDGWMVASRSAKLLYETFAQAHRERKTVDEDALSDMREFVPFFSRDALIAAIHQAASLSLADAEVIIDFLTFRADKGQTIWTQPLVRVGEAKELYPVFGALAFPPNLRYILESWMSQLRIKLDRRGPEFERHLRKTLIDAAAESSLLSAISQVVPNDWTFSCSAGSCQIDALFRIGGQVFVVEAKCILEPVDSNSIGTHRASIEHAVQQARYRTSLIESNRSRFIAEVRSLGWILPIDFKVSPLVAVSTVAHAGVAFEDVAVVDEYILRSYFLGGNRVVGMSWNMEIAEDEIYPYYSSPVEAEAYAADYFTHPPQLKKYVDALHINITPIYPATAGDWSGEVIDFVQR